MVINRITSYNVCYTKLLRQHAPDKQPFSGNRYDGEIFDRADRAETGTDISHGGGHGRKRPRWAGAIDTVAGNILASAIKTTKYGGSVTCCGNVGSAELVSSIS